MEGSNSDLLQPGRRARGHTLLQHTAARYQRRNLREGADGRTTTRSSSYHPTIWSNQQQESRENNLTKHQIPTGNQSAVRQRPYRIIPWTEGGCCEGASRNAH